MRNSQSNRLSFLHLCAGLSLLAAGPVFADSTTAAPSAFCREAWLKHFMVKGSGDAFDGKDLCTVDAAAIPAKLQDALRDAKETHEKVAQVFGLRPDELFGEGVNLKITAGKDGMNGTYADDLREVQLGAFKNPRRWIDTAVYAHELGHWIADSKNPLVPEYFRGSRHSFLLDETLPDTVALAAYGTTNMPDPTLPACMVPRVINGQQTYAAPMSQFALSSGARDILACCKANHGRLSPEVSGMCASIASEIKWEPLPARANEKFSLRAALGNLDLIDTHRIGLPVNSFLYALGQKFGRPVYQEFLAASAKAPTENLSCRLEIDGKKGERVRIALVPFGSQLQAYHQSLSAPEQAYATSMIKKFGLESAAAVDEDDLGSRASLLGLNAAFLAMEKNSSARLNQKHRCYAPLKKYMHTEGAQPARGCVAICDPI